jgi:hypothetical protein
MAIAKRFKGDIPLNSNRRANQRINRLLISKSQAQALVQNPPSVVQLYSLSNQFKLFNNSLSSLNNDILSFINLISHFQSENSSKPEVSFGVMPNEIPEREREEEPEPAVSFNSPFKDVRTPKKRMGRPPGIKNKPKIVASPVPLMSEIYGREGDDRFEQTSPITPPARVRRVKKVRL